MTDIRCVVCNEPLDPRSRADRVTCSSRCRVARWRRLRAANRVGLVSMTGRPFAPASGGVAAVTSALGLWLADVTAEAIFAAPYGGIGSIPGQAAVEPDSETRRREST